MADTREQLRRGAGAGSEGETLYSGDSIRWGGPTLNTPPQHSPIWNGPLSGSSLTFSVTVPPDPQDDGLVASGTNWQAPAFSNISGTGAGTVEGSRITGMFGGDFAVIGRQRTRGQLQRRQVMADNSLLHGTYSMLTTGFIQAGLKNPAPPVRPAPFEVVLGEIYRPSFTIPAFRFPSPEAPVMAGFLPSEQFPQPPEADWPSYRVHGGYIPVASLRIVEFDGRGGLRGNAIGVAGGRPAIQSGNDFLPAVNEVPMYSEFSGYQVDPGGKIARARMTWNHGSGTEPEYHVGI